MSYSTTNPKVLVLAKTKSASDRISQALMTEPVRIVHVTESQSYSDLLRDLEAACILVEIAQNPQSDLEAITSIHSRGRSLPLIAVSNQWTVSGAVQAIKSGADEVCDLQTQITELRAIVHKAIWSECSKQGELQDVIPESILQKLDSEEARIVYLIVLGLTAKEIGSTLDVSIRTYHYRKKGIFVKLGIANRSELIEMIRTSTGRISDWHKPHSIPSPSLLRRPAFASSELPSSR